MGSMAAYIRDIRRQAEAADGFEAPAVLSDTEQRKAVFTGSGDSLAAAMLAEAFSDYKARALDPQEIGRNPATIRGKTVYVISVSGRTVANVELARKHDVVAITAAADGALAGAARRVIPLSFPNSDTLTAGSISFLNSALVCLSLVRPAAPRRTGRILEWAHRDAAAGPTAETTYFVGNQHTFPVAMYAAAKTYEVLGGRAHYTRTEQFAHMELFSIRPGDAVVFFDQAARVKNMAEALDAMGVACAIVDPRLPDPVSDILYMTFYAQALPLNGTGGGDAGVSVGRRGISWRWPKSGGEVYFMEADALRGISDAAIY